MKKDKAKFHNLVVRKKSIHILTRLIYILLIFDTVALPVMPDLTVLVSSDFISVRDKQT